MITPTSAVGAAHPRPCILALAFAAFSWASLPNVLASDYVLMKGDRAVCDSLLRDQDVVEFLRPRVGKADQIWSQYTERCPDLLKSDKRQRRVLSDDYALYETDIDNDGAKDKVLYRRFDRPRYVTSIVEGREGRRLAGMESVEEFLIVDLQSCKTETVFSSYPKNDLVEVSGYTYIQNVNQHDARKAKAIYKKIKGQPLLGSYQDELCLFRIEAK